MNNYRKIGENVSLWLFLFFLVIVTFYIVYNAEWILGDNYLSMQHTGIGKPVPVISEIVGGGISTGRFSPTAPLDYNILTIFTWSHTITAHYIVNALFFILLSVFSVTLLKIVQHYYFGSKSLILPILVYILLFIGCSHITAFLDIIFYHRLASLLFVLIFYLIFLNRESGQSKCLVYTIPMVIWVTFCNETIFSSFFVIGVSLLLFNYKNSSKAQNRYAVFLVADAVLYLLLYAFIVLPQKTSTYTPIPNNNFFKDLLLWTPQTMLVLAMSVLRLYYILIKKDTSRIYIDAILFGGAVLALANIVLGLSTAYYYMIVMVFLMPSFLYWAYYFYQKSKRLFYVLGIAMLMLFMRPIHLFPYLIVNNQHRRTTEMACIRQVEPYVKEDNCRIYFLTGAVPEVSYERNVRIFVKRVLKETYEFETKRDIQVKELNDITNGEYPHLFLTKQDAKYLEKVQEDYLKQCYDSIQSFGDLNVIFYKKR